MLNPPSEAEQKAIYEIDKGRCDSWREHIFNLAASVETPDFSNTAARMLASGWSLAGIFRAQSGQPLTHHHRHRPGAVGDAGEQSARQSGERQPVR